MLEFGEEGALKGLRKEITDHGLGGAILNLQLSFLNLVG